MKNVLVVMPVINLWEQYIANALKSIVSKENKVKILVIDNGSVDGTREKLQKLRDEKIIELFDNETNKGVSGAWNQGISYGFATKHFDKEGKEFFYDYVLVVNSDVLLHETCIDEMVKVLEGLKNCYMITACNIRGDIPVVSQEKVNSIKHGDSYSPHPDFACFMVRKEILEKVGEFDEGFFPAFHEDNDFHRRMKIALDNNSALSCTQAMFYHYGSRTWQQHHKGLNDELKFIATKQYYIKKWGGEVGQEQYALPWKTYPINATLQNAKQIGLSL